MIELLETGRGGPMFRWLGQEPAIDLANTVLVVKPGDVRDLLADQEQLLLWLEHQRDRLQIGRLEEGDAVALRQLRDVVHRAFRAVAAGGAIASRDVARLNEASAAAPRYPQLHVRRDGSHSAVERSTAASSLDDLLGSLARSAIELLGGPDADRLRICNAPNCGMFYIARQRRQRWCCTACGNRARVAAHYRRKAEQAA
jgi:predicted RNA-binding Zn ribbon-like protein